MKKMALFLCFAVFFAVSLLCNISVFAADDVKLVVNDKKVTCDVPPVIINSRTMVPVRSLFEYLDANVSWNDALKQVIVTSDETVMIFTINSNIAYLNTGTVYLDAVPVIIDSRTLVPVRFISENLGYDVEWNGTSRTVYVTKNTKTEALPEADSGNQSDSRPDTKPSEEPDRTFAANITSVDVRQKAEHLEITVAITSKTEPEISVLTNPDRVVVDFKNVYQQCNDGKYRAGDYPIKEIRWARHDIYSRIVIESEEAVKYSWKYTSSKKLVIKVNTTELPEDSGETNSGDDKYEIPEINITGAPTVVIDAGHGGRDSGAVGRDDDGEIILMEKTVCLDIAKKVTSLLTSNGINVIMTRSEDVALGDTTMDDLLERCEIANNSDACLFVSIHNNAFTDSEASGTCILYAGLSTNENYGITGKQLAQNILTPLVEVVGLQNRGLVESPNIVVLKRTVMPAALIECAFITCKDDQKILGSESKRKDMAEAIYEGIVKSLKQMGRIK